MILMKDDLRLLIELYRYRYLMTRQVYALFPKRSQQGLRRRLRMMRKQGLIRCQERAFRPSSDSHNTYALSTMGLQIVAGEYGCSAEVLESSFRAASARHTMYLPHYALTNDVHIVLEQALSDHTHLVLHQWISEFALKDEKSPVNDKRNRFLLKQMFSHKGRKMPWEPDGAFLVSRRDDPRQALYCLEADRGTESHARIRDKAIAYWLFKEAKGYKAFGAVACYVIFVLESRKRLKNMCEGLQRLMQSLREQHAAELKEFKPLKFFLTVKDDLTPESFFDEAVWTTHEGEVRALFKSPSTSIPQVRPTEVSHG